MKRATALVFLFAGCLRLPPAISSQFTLEVCIAAKSRKRTLKPPF